MILYVVYLFYLYGNYWYEDMFYFSYKSLWHWMIFSHERTPMDEAVSRGKMDVIDAINAAVAQVELTGIGVSET